MTKKGENSLLVIFSLKAVAKWRLVLTFKFFDTFRAKKVLIKINWHRKFWENITYPCWLLISLSREFELCTSVMNLLLIFLLFLITTMACMCPIPVKNGIAPEKVLRIFNFNISVISILHLAWWTLVWGKKIHEFY